MGLFLPRIAQDIMAAAVVAAVEDSGLADTFSVFPATEWGDVEGRSVVVGCESAECPEPYSGARSWEAVVSVEMFTLREDVRTRAAWQDAVFGATDSLDALAAMEEAAAAEGWTIANCVPQKMAQEVQDGTHVAKVDFVLTLARTPEQLNGNK